MKTLTKEDLPIGTKVVPHGKTRGIPFEECDSWNTHEARKQGYLYVTRNDKDGYLALNELPNKKIGSYYNYSDVTLYNEQPKIKKSELLNRIEMLEKKVADLEEKAKVTIVYPPTWATEPGTIIGKGTIEGEAEKPHRDVLGSPFQKPEFTKPSDKPQYEVGKVYKLDLAMFYCTKIKDGKPYGFGFDYFGNWHEEDGIPFSGNLTESKPEEWFKRLEEEAKKRGFVKGVKVNPLWETPKDSWEVLTNTNATRFKNGCFFMSCCVMHNGKWAEIIEEPRMTVKERDELAKPFNPDEYQIGTIGIFWDGYFDEQMRRGCVIFGELDHITENGHFRCKGKSWLWYNFKPIKID